MKTGIKKLVNKQTLRWAFLALLVGGFIFVFNSCTNDDAANNSGQPTGVSGGPSTPGVDASAAAITFDTAAQRSLMVALGLTSGDANEYMARLDESPTGAIRTPIYTEGAIQSCLDTHCTIQTNTPTPVEKPAGTIDDADSTLVDRGWYSTDITYTDDTTATPSTNTTIWYVERDKGGSTLRLYTQQQRAILDDGVDETIAPTLAPVDSTTGEEATASTP